MLIPPLDEVIRITRVFGADRGRYRHGGLNLAQLPEDLKALEAHVRESCVTKARILAELRPIRTVVCGAVRSARFGVVGAALRQVPR